MGLLDAWAYGISCVVTPVGGLPDVIEEGKNCLTFPFDDVDALTMQLRKLMESLIFAGIWLNILKASERGCSLLLW